MKSWINNEVIAKELNLALEKGSEEFVAKLKSIVIEVGPTFVIKDTNLSRSTIYRLTNNVGIDTIMQLLSAFNLGFVLEEKKDDAQQSRNSRQRKGI
jgi:DNA-binding phage protein